MEDAIVLTYDISADDFTRAGEASSDVKRKLKQMGVDPEAIRKVAIACLLYTSTFAVVADHVGSGVVDLRRRLFPVIISLVLNAQLMS